nr:interleukin 17-3 [Sepiella japonica]
MTNVIIFSVAFFCGMLFVSGAPLSSTCKIPSDLNIHYERLAKASMGNKFMLPAEYISSSSKQTLHRGETTCPKSLPRSGKTQDRSTCPWYTKIITDSTLFPSVRSEAVCRCHDCIGSDGMHNCERVYSEMFFLQLTSVCVDGLFVYEPITKRIPTGCVCAHKITSDPSNTKYDI